MSWIREGSLSIVQRFAMAVIKCGDIPQHIAFIMDGNRRFASKANVKKSEGHSQGFDKLAETLKWCLDLGVREVTVYAFSIENFKRSREEVDCLLDLARQKFERLLEEEENLNRQGVNIQVIGNLKMLPEDLQILIARAVAMTRHNKRARLNVAFAYTSSDEVHEATVRVIEGVKNNDLKLDDINSTLFEAAMYTQDSLPLDLLIRTSGEIRLSDFMLWQSSHCLIHFTNALWPEFSFWDFMWAVFQYQRSKPFLQMPPPHPLTSSAKDFLSKLYENRFSNLAVMLHDRYWNSVRERKVSPLVKLCSMNFFNP